jgi:hypothetical protein
LPLVPGENNKKFNHAAIIKSGINMTRMNAALDAMNSSDPQLALLLQKLLKNYAYG